MAKNPKKISKSIKHTTSARQHPKHFLKVYWPYIPVIAVVTFSMLFSPVNPVYKVAQPATLAYATEMGASSLLAATNAQRADNGLGPLTLNTKLNASAQAKANDMVSRDYWNHNTPDGKEPWVFFDAAGYVYQKAGENLANSFSTSEATVIGWMNSPSHRANILDTSYTEVGFGFVNAENFTGKGESTVVVAHYGQPLTAVNPTPAPAAASQPATQSATKTTPTPTPAPTPETPPVEEPVIESQEAPVENENAPVNTETASSEKPTTNITRLQWLTGGKAPWSALAISLISFVVVVIWLIKHAVLVKRYVVQGEHFVAHHPVFDVIVVLVAAIAVFLSQYVGSVL